MWGTERRSRVAHSPLFSPLPFSLSLANLFSIQACVSTDIIGQVGGRIGVSDEVHFCINRIDE